MGVAKKKENLKNVFPQNYMWFKCERAYLGSCGLLKVDF